MTPTKTFVTKSGLKGTNSSPSSVHLFHTFLKNFSSSLEKWHSSFQLQNVI